MKTNSFDSDVFVIGGGPAGLAAAIAARRQGFRAMVADVARPPIDKVCGEGLMPDSVAELSKLGVSLDGYQQGAFRGIRFVGPSATISADFPSGHGVGMRRTTLHLALAERAAKCGIDLLWGVRVEGISQSAISLGGRRITARWIVGADGHNSIVRRWANLDTGSEVERRFALRQHFRMGATPKYVEIHWGEDAQAYVTPVGEDEVCVAIISRRKLHDFRAEAQRIASLSQLLAGAQETTAVRGGVSISRRLSRVSRDNIALVGDASGSVDAITGEGLALSFRHGMALADSMAMNDPARYQAAHRKIGTLPQFMSRAMLLMDKSFLIRRKALAAFQADPGLFQRMLAVHVGEVAIEDFGAGTLARFGWQLVNA